jgi:hypothetical protein
MAMVVVVTVAVFVVTAYTATAMTAVTAKTSGLSAIVGFMVYLLAWMVLSVLIVGVGQSATRMLRVLPIRFPTPALWFSCTTPRLPANAWSLVTTRRLPESEAPGPEFLRQRDVLLRKHAVIDALRVSTDADRKALAC